MSSDLDALREWVAAKARDLPPAGLTDDLPLLEGRHLTSLHVPELITPLEPSELTSGELASYADLPPGPRRREWLTARRALRQALGGLGLPADTSAYRFPSPAASLSHSADTAVAAVAVGSPGAVTGVRTMMGPSTW